MLQLNGNNNTPLHISHINCARVYYSFSYSQAVNSSFIWCCSFQTVRNKLRECSQKANN